MKKVSIIIAMIFLSANAYSQNYFKEIYESLGKNDRFSNMMNLRLYQEIFPQRAITYFLLGNIDDLYMREADPLLMFDDLDSNYRLLLAHFGVSKIKLDNHQANQDREYFGNIEIISDKRKPGLPDILNEIEKRLTDAKTYFTDASEVHDNYIRCITKYNECLFKYRKITRLNPEYKTLLLGTNLQVRSEIERLSLDFDSVLVYFNAYKNACKKLPNLLKVNDYQLNDIVTYRLEGLTEADFTSKTVRLWNFKSWADHFLELLNTDIASIRSGIEEADLRLTNQAEKLKQETTFSDKLPSYASTEKLNYLTGKYDYASISNELIAYKNSKIRYLLKTRSEMNNPSDTVDYELISKLMFFKDLADTKVALNIQADQLKKRISVENTSKYVNFFFEHYKGMEGLIRWCETEKYDNDNVFDNNLPNLDAFIQKTAHQYDYTDSSILYGKKRIAFGVQHDLCEKPVKDTLITHRVTPFQKKWFYLDGKEFKKDGTDNLFLAKINPPGKIDWMCSPELKGFKNRDSDITSLQALDDSTCWILCRTTRILKDSSSQCYTYKSVLNRKGRIEQQTVIDTSFCPVYFWVDEINEQYLVMLSDCSTHSNQPASREIKVRLYNFNDSLTWQNRFYLTGNIVDVIVSNSNFYIVCNYNNLSFSNSNKNISLHSETSGIAGIYIERNGSVSHINTYKTKENLLVSFSKKVFDNSLNLFGENKKTDKTGKNLFYLLVDNQGIPIFSNIDDLGFDSIKINKK